MRPNDVTNDGAVYECFQCGSRTSASEAGRCSDCGGELLNLGVPRDL
ncbi:rubrerythrin-like domain-containing protein [Halostella litorea]|nr:rubrerythrin-like domain-containing protein [Halostella litorea]